MNVKKLFSSKTKCTVDIEEFNLNLPQTWSGKVDGWYLFPYNEINCSTIKWLLLHDVKTVNLSWIADLFPNLEILEIEFHKNQSLTSLKGIEMLTKLHALKVHEGGGKLHLENLDNLRLDYFFFSGNGSDQYEVDARVINKKPIYVRIIQTEVHVIDHLREITCEKIYLSNIRNSDGKIFTHYSGDSASLELTIDEDLNGQ